MNPQSQKNLNNGRTMDVMSGSSQNNPINSPPPPQNNVMAPADDITQATNSPNMNAPTPKKSKRPNTKIVILVTVIAMLLLGLLLAGLLYMQSKNDSQQDEDVVNNTQSTQPTDGERVTTTEIDTTLADIDKTLNTLNDGEDFSPDDISNDSLGLSE